MVVYHRKDHRRGVVTAGNQFTGMIAVQWDDGTRQLINVQELMSEKLYNEIKEEERLTLMGIKAEQATIGAVVFASGHKAPLAKGKIAGPVTGNIVIVEWDDGRLDKRQLNSLLTEVAGSAEDKRLQDEAERLEKEFAEVEQVCKTKLQQAAQLVREAAKLADAKNVDLQDMHEATHDLEYAMEAAGWRTSSWHC
jgi:methionine synthase II (cobalamin-independent)